MTDDHYTAQDWIAAFQHLNHEPVNDVVVAWAMPVHTENTPPTFHLYVPKCPYCGNPHMHSPGWGTRHSHCNAGDEYALTPPPGFTTDDAIGISIRHHDYNPDHT